MFNWKQLYSDVEEAIGPVSDLDEARRVRSILIEKGKTYSVDDLREHKPSVYQIKNQPLPQSILNYGDFMARTAARTLRGEDLARAQMITLSSIQRSASRVATISGLCSRPESQLAKTLTAIGITPDCFQSGFFVEDIGYMTPRMAGKGRAARWFPMVRPEDTMARFLQVAPSADVFVQEMLALVAPAREVAAREWSLVKGQPEFLNKMRRSRSIQSAIAALPGGLQDPAAMQAALSPQSQRYLSAIVGAFEAFGLQTQLGGQILTWLPRTLVYQDMIFDLVRGPKVGHLLAAYYKAEFFRGAGIAKIPFTAAMLGRGDLPVMDAREIEVFFKPDRYRFDIDKAGPKMGAVPILADRMSQLNVQMPSSLEPFRQYLTHHYVWDASEGDDTTHADMIRAIEGGKFGLFGFMRRGR
jgi:hypothetical protein